MTTVQRTIKYCAIVFASILAVGIITFCAGIAIKVAAGVVIIEGMGEKSTISFSKDFDAEDIKKLYVKNYEAKLTIETGDAFHVEAINVEEDYVAELRDGDTLYLGSANSNVTRFWLLNWTEFGENSPQIILTIPRDFYAKEIVLDTGSGSSSVNGLKAEELLFDCGSGKFTASNCEAKKLSLDGASGSVTLDDFKCGATTMETGSGRVEISNAEFGDFTIESGSGSVSMTNVATDDFSLDASSGRVRFEGGTINGDIAIDAGSGSVTIQAKADIADYETTYSTGSGGIWVNGEKVSEDDHSKPAGAIYELAIEGSSGRVSVDLSK